MNEQEFRERLQGAIEFLQEPFEEEEVASARSFGDAGVLTRNEGFVVRMRDGSEFQVTIVQSKKER